ncbi:MAG: MerC family mercury resistance protein [Pseudomonadota bacterium]
MRKPLNDGSEHDNGGHGQETSWLDRVGHRSACNDGCYGTLAAVALLSVIGASVEVDEGFLVKLISGLLLLALAGMGYSYRIHRHSGPLLLSIVSAMLLAWVFYGSYSKPLQLTGFAMLAAASIWDFRAKRRVCTDQPCGGQQ